MQQHVVIGARMLDNEEIDSMAKHVALYHHERWNGTGYLHRLTAEDIPLEARIVAIADVYDALVSERVYKKAFTDEEAYKIIREESGKHFEPKIAEIFLESTDTIQKIKKHFS